MERIGKQTSLYPVPEVAAESVALLAPKEKMGKK